MNLQATPNNSSRLRRNTLSFAYIFVKRACRHFFGHAEVFRQSAKMSRGVT
jgi:hypothetical protein